MSNDAASAEAKAKYDAAKKELLHALGKKRNLDKQLVGSLPYSSASFPAYMAERIGATRGPDLQPGDVLPNGDCRA